MNCIINPVGYVRNAAKERKGLKPGGVPAVIEIDPAYKACLDGLKAVSHIWVLCFFHKADRTVLKARPKKISSSIEERGVFAMRSPDRPNPLALTCARLLKIKGTTLYVDKLDAIDGTPVADIKVYSPAIDCVPCASSPDFSGKYAQAKDSFVYDIMLRTAANAVGPSRAAELAALTAFKFVRLTGKGTENFLPDMISTTLPPEGADALFALFGARPSKTTLRIHKGKQPYKTVIAKGGTAYEITAEPDELSYFD